MMSFIQNNFLLFLQYFGVFVLLAIVFTIIGVNILNSRNQLLKTKYWFAFVPGWIFGILSSISAALAIFSLIIQFFVYIKHS
jgi:hypothetical protein